MKKLLIFLCMSSIVLIAACSNIQQTNSNSLQQTAPQPSAKVQLKSKNNLEKWNITVTPKLGVKAEYLGNSDILMYTNDGGKSWGEVKSWLK